MTIDPANLAGSMLNLFNGARSGAGPAADPGGAQHGGGPQMGGDLMSALAGALPNAFQQALGGASPTAANDMANQIQQFLGGGQPHQPAGGAAPPKRRHGGRKGGGGKRSGKHRRAKAARAKRQAHVQGTKAARTPGAHQGKGVKGGDFNGLTTKLQQMGISKQDVSNLSQKYGVPERMILGVMMQESKGNPTISSPVGAKGLMQLMPATARELGVKDRSDPKQNLEGGVKYLGQMLKKFGGNESKALAAYNAGPGRVQRAGGVPHIKETQNYVRIISGNMSAAQAAFDAWK